MKMRKIAGLLLAACMVVSNVNVTGFISGVSQVEAKAKNAVTIDVTDFGADPSGKNDSTDAVREALKEAKEAEGEVVINFPTGEYHFWKDYGAKRTYHTSNTGSLSYPEKTIAILLEELEDVTLEGNGSSLIMHGDMMAIAAVKSKNVRFHDFVLDYKDPDTIDISVVENGIDENGKQYADFYVPANYSYKISEDKRHVTWQGDISPVTGKPYWTKESADFCVMLVIYKGYDQTVARASNKQASNPFTGVSHIEKRGENILRFTYDGQRPQDQEEGNIFLLSDSSTRKTTGAFFWESEDVLVDDIDVHYLSGFGWLTQMCKNVEFKKVDFLPRYGTGKYTTSNADQLHIAGCGGYFKVTDCNFSMAHDDPINIHGSYMRVEEVIDNRTLKVRYIHGQQGGFRQFHPGDEVLFYSRTYLEPPAGESEEHPYIVESSIAPGEEYDGQNLDMRTEVITFEDEFDKETLNDLKIQVTRNNSSTKEGLYVAENITYTPEVIISGNHMKSIPTRGILCTTRKPVVIENNTFDNMAMANIYLSNDANYWYESGPIRNMTIRNNKFYIRPTGQNEWGNVSGVFVDPVVLTGIQDAPPSKGDIPVHRNITIEGNEFHMANDNVVTANGVDGMKILNNKIVRDDAGIKLSLEQETSLEAGEARDIKADVNESVLRKDVFKFTNCHNVEIGGNTYDDGFNLNITTAGNKMTEADVKNNDKLVTLNKPGGNLITSESKVKYVTSDPSVAYVNENKKLVGIKEGIAEVTAYVEWNGTVIKSNPMTVTVGNGAETEVTITADKTEIISENGTATLTYSEGAKIEVLDPATGKHTNRAYVNGNTYHAINEGAVVVKASKEGKSSSILIVNNFEKSYGNADYLNVAVSSLNKAKLSGGKNEFEIVAEDGRGLFAGDSRVNNLVKIPVPEELKEDLRIQATVTGLPAYKGNTWNGVEVFLYKDDNNFFSASKKEHLSGVITVYEENGSPTERNNNDTTADKSESITFEIAIEDNVATIRYKDMSGTWKTAGSRDNISRITDSDLFVALGAWKNGGADFITTFSDIKIARASETTTEDMSQVESQQIFNGFENDRPEITALDFSVNGVNEKATVKAEATDSDGVKEVVYQWVFTDKKGVETVTYAKEGSYIPTEAGTLQVNAVAIDIYGKPGTVFASEEKEVAVHISSEEDLANLYINGNQVDGFAKKDAVFTMPEGTDKTIRVSIDAENTGIKTVVKDSAGEKLAQLDETGAALVAVPEDGKLIIERGTTAYEVTVKYQVEGITAVNELRVNGEAVDLRTPIKAGTNSYFVQLSGTDDARIELISDVSVESITATSSFFEKEVKNESSEAGKFVANVDLTAGINAFYFKVNGADKISEKNLCLYVFRDGYNESFAKGIKVNGETIEDFAPEKEDYTIYVEKENADVEIEVEQGAEDQTTSITKEGVRIEGTKASCKLKDGLNQIVIANKSQNMWTTTFYTLNVVVRSDDNAGLLNLSADEKLSPLFDALDNRTTEYEISMSKDKLHVEAQAQMENAKIAVYTDSEKAIGVGTVVADFNIYEGENTVKIKVEAPDGVTKKWYTIHVNAEGVVYATDMMEKAIKSTVGYGSLGIDQSPGEGEIALMNEAGERVPFKKGLGAHASSEVSYDIEGMGFETFEAYVGIDYFQVTQGDVPSSVTFRVVVDGTEVYNSGKELTVKDPMQKVEVDVRGASVIQLFADSGVNNWNDHSVWADARFTKPLQARPAGNKEDLAALIDYAKLQKDNADYAEVIPVVQKAFEAALTAAIAVHEKEEATQLQVDAAYDKLLAMVHLLDFVKGDTTKLQTLVDSVAHMNKDHYTSESWSRMETALTEADKVLADENAMQKEIDEVREALRDAIFGLRLRPNKDKLEELIKGAQAIDTANYTVKSASAFAAALDNAKAVFADGDATEEDVKSAETTLEEAQKNLVAKVDEDKDTDEVQSDNSQALENAKTAAKSAAKTGDASQMAVILTMLMAAGAAVLSFRRKFTK